MSNESETEIKVAKRSEKYANNAYQRKMSKAKNFIFNRMRETDPCTFYVLMAEFNKSEGGKISDKGLI